MRPSGLLLSFLVFGSFPTFPTLIRTLPAQEQKMKMMEITGDEIAEIRAEQRFETAIRSSLPPSAKYTLTTGDKSSVYCEQKKKWLPRMKIVDLNEKNF